MIVDAKLSSKMFGTKDEESSDQVIYIYIYVGESVINDIPEYTANSDIEAVLFSADFEKAFDSIDYTL